MATMNVVTFRPPQGCRGEDGPEYQGNFRKANCAGLLRLTKTTVSAVIHAANSARLMRLPAVSAAFIRFVMTHASAADSV